MHEKKYLPALLHGKCPRCREGNLFTYPIHNLTRFNVMNTLCPHCGVRLEPEPGFYQGAMYVGYGFTVGFIAFASFLLYSLGEFSDMVYISVCIGGMLLLVPFNYRYSRIVYLYLFGGIKYDARLSQTK
ncbi:DUF983 domain-containing protein [Chryseolinea lacunae]|uniref:DUF983 domain-containing protein n=1 Tax=Chryseolinea lacunae TaxID=2801331 RepID=A0ABS1KKI7_9BACT|nr:DUF983 domain-containing protein [Chryseolinea lacunae]MBL0739742.1 DUF983 domain-containing protein [Chryseolinea lacunae]